MNLVQTCLFGAVMVVSLGVARRASTQSFEVDSLEKAIRESSPDKVRSWLQDGANVNQKIEKGDDAGLSVLMQAVLYSGPIRDAEDRIQIVKILLQRGANPNLQVNSGLTALIFAERMNNARVIRLLKQFGARNPRKARNIRLALNTKADAYLMIGIAAHYAVSTGSQKKNPTFEDLAHLATGLRWEIVRRKGIDPFGNSLSFFPEEIESVSISQETFLSAGLPATFWPPFSIEQGRRVAP